MYIEKYMQNKLIQGFLKPLHFDSFESFFDSVLSILFSAALSSVPCSPLVLEHSFKKNFFFLSSTTLLLPTHLPPPSCAHAQSCNPMDCSPPGSSVHGLFQARILEWVAISFSGVRAFKKTFTKGNKIHWSEF